MYAGFYVEKGFDSVLSTMSGVKRPHIMQPDWYWHEFLDHARATRYDESMREVLKRSRCPLWLSIDTQEFNKPPELDTERSPFYDMVQFTVHSEDLRLKIERTGKKTLMQLNTCVNIREVGELLEEWKISDSSG